MIDKSGLIRWILARVNQIFEIAAAILRLNETGGSLTTDGTEQDVYITDNPLGVFKPLKFMIDFTAQTVTETVVLRVYYRISATGNLIKKDEMTIAGAQDPDLINVELEPNRFGFQITIEKTAGTNRAYPWAIFYEV